MDIKAFRDFLYSTEAYSLGYIDLSGTNINDDICYAIYTLQEKSKTLRGIDISKCTKVHFLLINLCKKSKMVSLTTL